jgi:hypothetical protein
MSVFHNMGSHVEPVGWGTFAKGRKCVGSITYDFIGIFHWLYLFGSFMALGSIQHLTEMCKQKFPGGFTAVFV